MASPHLVLLLADSRITRQVTTSCLESYGFEVISASNGAEALAHLGSNRRIRTLVCDAEMRGEPDGLDIARTARELNPKLNVIYTARFPYSVPEGRKVSGAPMLRAPYAPQQIVGVIGELRGGSSREAGDAWAA